DRREVLLSLTPKGEKVLRQLALHHWNELRTAGPTLLTALSRVVRRVGTTKSTNRKRERVSPEIKTESRKRPGPRERLLVISLLGIVVGATGGLVAEALLRAINFLTDLFFYGKFSSAYLPPNEAPHHWWLIFLPAAGGLAVGLLIHYFSPEIKGDGIPEA